MSDRRNELADTKTNPGTPDVDASEDANTAVINPPSESQPTAPIPAEVKGTAPAPRLKTAPYMIFDAVSAKDAEARKNPALHGNTGSQPVPVVTPEGESPEPKLTGGGSPTIPGPGPKAPGASPKSSRELLPVKGPEPIPMNGSNADGEPARRVVSTTGAFVGGILAIGIVAGAAVAAFIVKGTPQPPPVPTVATASTTAPPPSSATTTSQDTTTKSTSTPSASASVATASPSASASASNDATPSNALADDKPLPKETGNKPSKQALDRLLAQLKPVLGACVKGQAKALYSVKITFDPATGRATDAQTFVPLTKTVAGGCVLSNAFAARVNPYNGPPFTAEVKFAP